MFQGTTWTSCLFALVSVIPEGMAVNYCMSTIALTALPCQPSNIHGQGHMKSYLRQPVIASPIIRQTEMECLPASISTPSQVKHLWFQKKHVEADSQSVTKPWLGGHEVTGCRK